jgi:hypothetical protein
MKLPVSAKVAFCFVVALFLTVCLIQAVGEETSHGAANSSLGSSSASEPPRPVTFQQGVNGYDGCKDTTICDPTWECGADPCRDPWLSVRSQDGKAALISFDVSSIPVSSIVHSAFLQLWAPPVSGGLDIKVCVYEVLRPWQECEATWLSATNTEPWWTPGCNYPDEDRAYLEVDCETVQPGRWRDYRFTVTDLAQQWVVRKGSNLGVILKSLDGRWSQEYRFVSSEGARITNRPKLTIYYSPPGPPADIELTSEVTRVVVGEATTITATVLDADGKYVANEYAVTFNTTLGSIDPRTTPVMDGLATATLTAAQTPGEATVSATCESADAKPIEIEFLNLPADHFRFDKIAQQTACKWFNLRVTAEDQYDNVDEGYSGEATLTASTEITTLTPVIFDQGEGTATVMIPQMDSSVVITATDVADDTITGTSNAFTVTRAITLEFGAIDADQCVRRAFSITLTAFDFCSAGYTGTAALTDTTGTITPTIITLTDGIVTVPVMIEQLCMTNTVTAIVEDVITRSEAFSVCACLWLPEVMRNYPPPPDLICNGDFETGDFSCWSVGGEITPTLVEMADVDPYVALLGDPELGNEELPTAGSWIYQVITVPVNYCGSASSSVLSLKYRVKTYDCSLLNSDSFAVWIQDSEGNPLREVLVVRAGDFESTEACGNLEDTGWKKVQDFSLDDLSGPPIGIYFMAISGDHRWNTWAYVDDVIVKCE